MTDEVSGIILDTELPLTKLARTLKMAEGEVYRRVLELVATSARASRAPSPGGTDASSSASPHP